ncbi:MAG TPA: cation diffusion facilitator family transporter [Prolixibacteraceae bacterium]|nr:cation diffusion facilitator family transporter [Prolixibacteraceae bacterium]
MINEDNKKYHKNYERKTLMVVLLTAVTMVVEIIFGIGTKSMALLADGIHMGSHVLAIGLSWLAYIFLRKASNKKDYSGKPEKILSLSGYSSGIILLMFAFVILWEAMQRIVHPHEIIYKEAIIVATIGLVINIISAFLLHHDQAHSDHNIKAAYLHVLADALTSLSAIAGLIIAMVWNVPFIDSIAAIISAIVIIKWSVGLLKNTGKSLLDIN